MAIQFSVLSCCRELDEKLTAGDHSCRSELGLPHSPLLEKSLELFGPVYVMSTDFGMIVPINPISSNCECGDRLEAEAKVRQCRFENDSRNIDSFLSQFVSHSGPREVLL